MLLNSVAGGNWVRARKQAAHLVESALCAALRGSPTRQRRTGFGNANTTVLSTSRLCPQFTERSATQRPARHFGSGVWYQAISSTGSRLPRIHRFPIVRKQPCPTSSRRVKVSACLWDSGMLLEVATKPTHVTVEWAQLQSSWISQVPSGPTSRTFPSSSYSIQRPPRSTTPKKTRRILPRSPCRNAYMRPFPCAQAGCRCCLVRLRRRQEASFGRSFSFSPTHVVPFCILPITWGWSQGFTQIAISPRPGHWRNFGIKLAISRPTEAPEWKCVMWAAMPLQAPQVLGNNMADTLSRMSADSLECDEAQVLHNTHIEQLASAFRKRGHLDNLAAHQVEPAERAPLERSSQPRPKAGAKRQWLLQETTHTLTKTDNYYHCESCHATVSRDRLNAWLQQGPCAAVLDAPFPVAIGHRSLHESHTITFLDDRRTWLCSACGHISRLRALKLAQPCPRVLSKVGRRNLIAIQNGRKLD